MAAAKKKKKTLRLLLLLLVVAALGAVYFLMDTGADEGIDELPTPTAAATQSNLVLCDLSAEDLVKVRFENDTFSATVIRKEDVPATLKRNRISRLIKPKQIMCLIICTKSANFCSKVLTLLSMD